MKSTSYARAYPMGQGIDSRSIALYFGISLAIHAIFIGSVIFMPHSASRPRLGQGAINVSLVSLPGPPAAGSKAPAAPAGKPAAKPVAIPQKEPKPAPKAPAVVEPPPPKPLPVAPTPPKTVSLAPKASKPKAKKSLKKQTIDRQKIIDQAVSKVAKKVEKSSTNSVQQALARLKEKVGQEEAAGSRPEAAAPGATAASGAGVSGTPGGAGGEGGKRALEITDLYRIEVAFQVERHWAFSQQLAGDDRTQQASLVFKVLPSGEITDIRFTQKSGNPYLDDSAYKAIVKANPVSPHPEGINVPYVTVGLRFTPEGLRK
jgi:colicin import membrane protein